MGWTRFAVAFDLHGDEQHAPTVKAFHRFCEDFKPHRRIIGGDVWDFQSLRRGESDKERRHEVMPDFRAGMDFIEKFKPDTILLGNHDFRLWRAAEAKDGPLSEFAAERIADIRAAAKKLDCDLIPYSKGRVTTLGPLKVLHGFFAGETSAKRHAQVYGPCIYGHVHTGEHAAVPRYGERQEAWSSPCMCRLDFDYAEDSPGTLKWEQGWIYGAFDGRRYHVETATVKDGRVLVSNGFREIAA